MTEKKFTRQQIWRHNGHIGSAKMMIAQCRSMLKSKTLTEEAKAIVVRIEQDAEFLASALKEKAKP